KCLDELDRIHFELKLDGVMWHHRFQGAPINHPLMRPILRKMAEYRLVPLVHTFADGTLESPLRLQELATDFPQVTFIALDAFTGSEQCQVVFQVARLTPNILFDTTLMIWPGIALQFVRSLGAERLAYGGTGYTPARTTRTIRILEFLRNSALGDTEKAK